MVERLVPVAAFSPRPLKDWCAWDMREGVVGGYPDATITAVVPREGFPGGGHAASVSSSSPLLTVPCFGLLLRGFWFRGTNADLNPWGVKRAVWGWFWLGPFPVYGTVLMAVTIVSPCWMHGAVWSLPWGVDRTLWAVVILHRVEGAVCCGVCLVWVKRAFRGALNSCSGVGRTVDGTWGVNWALCDGFRVGVGWAVGGVCLVWTLVQRGGTAETCGKAAEGCRTDKLKRRNKNNNNKFDCYIQISCK